MESNLDSQRSEIMSGLRRTFPDVWANCYSDQTEFCCQLGPSVADGILRFPFWNKDLEKHYPYDVVNAIWEYITRNL